jgi:hypothetical protein
MTTAAPDFPLTAADMLFGSSADAPEALARQIMSAGRTQAQSFGQAMKRLPRVTREAAAREAAGAAAGLLKVDLTEMLVAGWREHRDIIAAARRTLATPASKEMVGLAAHRIAAVQQPAVSVLIDGRRVHTLQLGLSIYFEVTGLVAGVSIGRLAHVHAGRCEIGVALTVHEIEVLTKRAHHVELPGVMALRSGFRLLPSSEYPDGEYPASQHAASQHPGTQHSGTQHAASKYAGTQHPASQFPDVELLNHRLPGTEHVSGDYAGSEHPASQVQGSERPSSR